MKGQKIYAVIESDSNNYDALYHEFYAQREDAETRAKALNDEYLKEVEEEGSFKVQELILK